jgi:CRP-like cAMP-binding protein
VLILEPRPAARAGAPVPAQRRFQADTREEGVEKMATLLWDNLFKRRPTENGIETLLKQNVLFQDLSFRQLKFLATIVHRRRYKAGEIIFRQGEFGVGMYIIVSGSVDIAIAKARSEPAERLDEIVITRLGAGDFFGELALVEPDGRRSAAARAAQETELIGFFKPDLMDILERNPSVGVKITLRLGEVIGCRLKETTRRLSALEAQLEQLQSE